MTLTSVGYYHRDNNGFLASSMPRLTKSLKPTFPTFYYPFRRFINLNPQDGPSAPSISVNKRSGRASHHQMRWSTLFEPSNFLLFTSFLRRERRDLRAKFLNYIRWTASLLAQNTLPLPIRTAALLGTPSKTLLSGTPEFVRGSRQFCVTLSVLARTQTLVIYFLPDLFRDGEAIPASIDEGEKCRTGIRKHWKYRTRNLGYDVLMEKILCRDAHTLPKLVA